MTARTSGTANAAATSRTTLGTVQTPPCTPTRRTTTTLMLRGTAARTLAAGTKRTMTKMQRIAQTPEVLPEVLLEVLPEVPLGAPPEVPLGVLPEVPLGAPPEVLLEAQHPAQCLPGRGLPAQVLPAQGVLVQEGAVPTLTGGRPEGWQSRCASETF